MKIWMIVNFDPERDCDSQWTCGNIPPSRRPGFVHLDKAAAEKELLRLKQRNPNGSFFLLEAVAFAREVDGFVPGEGCVKLEVLRDE